MDASELEEQLFACSDPSRLAHYAYSKGETHRNLVLNVVEQ